MTLLKSDEPANAIVDEGVEREITPVDPELTKVESDDEDSRIEEV